MIKDDKIKVRFCDLFKETLDDHIDLVDKLKEFLMFKAQNPIAPYGKDTAFVSSAPIGRTGLKLRHAHLTQDVSVVYKIHGKDPYIIDLYGIFRHKELGTSNTANIKKQQKVAKKFQSQDFRKDL